jgi:GNAT superfamily N-acetyltransferase
VSVSVESTIRTAKMTDAAEVALLICELGYQTSASEMRMRLQRIIGDARYRTFVAVKQGRVRGMIGTFAYYTLEHNDLGGRIVALVVSKNSRRIGIGRRLVAAVERDFAQRDIRRIAVNTRFEREEAHRFYENLGYRRNGFRFVKELRESA